ncbi:MAG: ABC transporter ATP-binding protein, partial [Chloroflexia bacterium]|nr:ABC transporter ATP-binding protein [Chloroflexia bacterium]
QEAELQDRLRVDEALALYAALYANPRPAEPLLEQWGLTDKRRSEFRQLSGGQKQRLFIALALINNPELVFLDELTSSLDPQARRLSWGLVRQVRDAGTTVVLVTHSMEEAERLCDRVAVIDRGRLVAFGSPDELTRIGGTGQRVRFSTNARFRREMLID